MSYKYFLENYYLKPILKEENLLQLTVTYRWHAIHLYVTGAALYRKHRENI